MKRMRDLLLWIRTRPVRLLLVIPALLIVLSVPVLLSGFRSAAAPKPQPIAFNHQIMVQFGMDCLYCHKEARQSPAAGIPSVDKCMGCHKVVDPNNPVIQEVAGYYNRKEPIPWNRVNILPRFVFFSHEVHVNSGVNCKDCHGDVAHMTVDLQVVRMNMGWCLSCHEKQPDSAQLIDCVICHR
jgi:hypothetical protein